jgi:Outer membrane protein beta-barrel domain
MKKGLMLLPAIAALGFAGQALAEGISYSYVEGDYLSSRLKDSGDHLSGDGFRFEGSAALGTNWLAFVEIGRTKYTESGDSLKFTPTGIGVGYHTALGGTVDFVGKASYDRVKLHIGLGGIGSGSTTESGWGLSAGLRGMVGEKVEWSSALKYRDVGDLQSIVSFSIGGRYYFTPAFGVGLDLSSQKYDKDVLDVTEQVAAITFRYNFGG